MIYWLCSGFFSIIYKRWTICCPDSFFLNAWLFILGLSFSLNYFTLDYFPLDVLGECRFCFTVNSLLLLLARNSLDTYVLLCFCPFFSVLECALCNLFCIPNEGITQSQNWREPCEHFAPSSSPLPLPQFCIGVLISFPSAVALLVGLD